MKNYSIMERDGDISQMRRELVSEIDGRVEALKSYDSVVPGIAGDQIDALESYKSDLIKWKE